MMIIDPVALGDVTCTRASVKYAWDKTGTLVQVPANTLAVTYNPSDLSKAPYALVEGAATNVFTQSENMTAWSAVNSTIQADVDYAPNGMQTSDRIIGASAISGGYRYITLNPGDLNCASIFVKRESGDTQLKFGSDQSGAALYAIFDLSAGTVGSLGSGVVAAGVIPCNTPYGVWYRIWLAFAAPAASTPFILYSVNSGMTFQAWGVQVEAGSAPTSYISASVATTRAADVIGTTPGLVASNVPITEVPYSAAATYAQNAIVYDPATYLMYQSLIASNTGKALTDATSWVATGSSVNRWQMFDKYNNTQTSNAEEVIAVFSTQAMARGIYLGNLDASEVRISVVDPGTGSLVYQEVQNLIVSTSGSSFFKWGFNRRKKKSYAVSVSLPPYANGLITIAIKKPGGTVKCGMCVVGPLVDVGLAQYGMSREIKDYSTVNFNFDGTSNVVKRNYAKIMDVDLIVDNDQIDSVVEALENYRQKPVAWIGASAYGSTCLFGAYTSFKSVIAYPMQSTMNLQIQGTV